MHLVSICVSQPRGGLKGSGRIIGSGTPKPGPSSLLREAVCQTLCQHVLAAFSTVLRRASRLPLTDQVEPRSEHVGIGLVAGNQDWLGIKGSQQG